MPHTPLTPGSTHTPIGGPTGGPPSVPPPSSNATTGVSTNSDGVKNNTGPPVHDATTSVDLPSDLNFDPAAVIEGEAQGQEGLNVSIFLGIFILFDEVVLVDWIKTAWSPPFRKINKQMK